MVRKRLRSSLPVWMKSSAVEQCKEKSRKCLLIDFLLVLFLLSPILKIKCAVLSVLSHSWL